VEDITYNSHIHQVNIHNTTAKYNDIEEQNNEYNTICDENSESDNLSIAKNQVASIDEHTQRSRDRLFIEYLKYFI
jgi:hypothetical protein